MERREFFGDVVRRAVHWGAPLSLLGFRLHVYANPVTTGWKGWITFCGRLVGFVRLNGKILWW